MASVFDVAAATPSDKSDAKVGAADIKTASNADVSKGKGKAAAENVAKAADDEDDDEVVFV